MMTFRVLAVAVVALWLAACGTCDLVSSHCGVNGHQVMCMIDTASGTLEITGTGAMKDWTASENLTLWPYRWTFKHIVVGEGVTTIGDRTLFGCANVTDVSLPSTLTKIGEHAFEGCTKLNNITIPSTVTSIKASAFASSGMESVIYNGTQDPADSDDNSVFNACNKLYFICLPTTYSSTSFCGKTEFCKSSECMTYRSQETSCKQAACDEDHNTYLRYRDDVAKWVDESTDCVEYKCDTVKGIYAENLCNDTSVCKDDVCVEKKTGGKWAVKIEFGSNALIDVDALVFEFQGQTTDILVSPEFDEGGHITRLTLYVDDKKTAETISNSVSKMNTDEGSPLYGLVKDVNVSEEPLDPSSAVRIDNVIFCAVLSVLVALLLL